MGKTFRLLLVEDIYVTAAKNWLNLNLPGTKDNSICRFDVATTVKDAIEKLRSSREDRYDGLIFDMDLEYGDKRDLAREDISVETMIQEKWPEWPKYIKDGSRISTGGLWVWAWAFKLYDRTVPPTIFFTGHGDQYSDFLDPMKWASMVFWIQKGFIAETADDMLRANESQTSGGVSFHDDNRSLKTQFDGIIDPVLRVLTGGANSIDPEAKELIAALVNRALNMPLDKMREETLKKFLNDKIESCAATVEKRLLSKEVINRSGTTQHKKDGPVFSPFIEEIRSRAIRNYFPEDIVKGLNRAGVGTKWSQLQHIHEPGANWSLPSLFPEFDFTLEGTIPPYIIGEEGDGHIDYMHKQLHHHSQIVALSKIWNDTKNIVHEITHIPEGKTKATSELKPMLTYFKKSLEPLHPEVREFIEKKVGSLMSKDIIGYDQVDKFRDLLREPDKKGKKGQGMHVIIKDVRDRIEEDLDKLRLGWNDCNEETYWRSDIYGFANESNSSITDLKNAIEKRLNNRAGQLFALGEACRGFFTPYIEIYLTDKQMYWKRNLMDISRGKWEKMKHVPMQWGNNDSGIPVRIWLLPLAL